MRSTMRVMNDEPRTRKENEDMHMFIDHHKGVEGLTADAVADGHRKDVEIQGEYGVAYHRYWFNEEVFCLVEAPAKKRPNPSTGRLTGCWPTRSPRSRKVSLNTSTADEQGRECNPRPLLACRSADRPIPSSHEWQRRCSRVQPFCYPWIPALSRE
jgi:hypothetical protein